MVGHCRLLRTYRERPLVRPWVYLQLVLPATKVRNALKDMAKPGATQVHRCLMAWA